MRVILDTNVLLVAAPRRSPYYWLYRVFLNERIEVGLSNSILTEYREKLLEHWQPQMAFDVLAALMEASNTVYVDPYYRFNLIKDDPDDNKFADCSVACNADYLVTADKHFNVLKAISFPKIQVVHPDEFKQILLDANLLEP